MHSPSKAAKKVAAKSAPKHDEGKDLRRVHEHKGRVEILRPLLGENLPDIDELIALAEQERAGSYLEDAADLMRAAEHLSFGYLASSRSDGHNDPKLSQSVREEFQHKLEKAEEHWEESEALGGIYQRTLDGAHRASEGGAHQKALELIRAAEAIAHVHLHHESKRAELLLA